MIAVLQRVRKASVTVRDQSVSTIGRGLLVLLGIASDDSDQDETFLIDKMLHLRIFSDGDGKMNRSLLDIQGELLLVSQFTLLANIRKGRRPSFESAASPEVARARYHRILACLREKHIPVQGGSFGEHMLVSLENDGPVTIIINSRESNLGRVKEPDTLTDKGMNDQKDLAWESQ
ncbi:MAG: D-tyrosyl-tRNA(Tyr) deacylase [Nitrospira sp.]|nr:D-tyrosyl-tRNA(Tyr) deacylase [Nitrospira sp.]MCB9711727.1 D-tyrosyl-tRNA(Tyr) deacylase [Nitrospiraceae bacterium]MDR4488687.1 D-aminoacyl-tRNA deacylase [Nitrospirales bacterium]MCA9467329.1 D-tyrosyl-tRNA(Tyr) deacylase [Nitrospira sp.]MCA9475753.1 D-tyrosyl-tRNA(Tyr) deacylase [Nitrospira sp.]